MTFFFRVLCFQGRYSFLVGGHHAHAEARKHKERSITSKHLWYTVSSCFTHDFVLFGRLCISSRRGFPHAKEVHTKYKNTVHYHVAGSRTNEYQGRPLPSKNDRASSWRRVPVPMCARVIKYHPKMTLHYRGGWIPW